MTKIIENENIFDKMGDFFFHDFCQWSSITTGTWPFYAVFKCKIDTVTRGDFGRQAEFDHP